MIPNIYNDWIVCSGGMKRVSSLTPGDDRIVEYRTNRLLPVRAVKLVNTTMLDVKMNDGTQAVIMANDYRSVPIKLYPVDFNNNSEMYDLDPYTVGALLMYGNYDDEYINLPGYINYLMTYMWYTHRWSLGYRIGPNGEYYFEKAWSDDLVRWSDIFSGMRCRLNDENEPLFPVEYATGSYRTRRQLLSGIFDVGYTDKMHDNRLVIYSKYEDRLIAVQEILRSLGILSDICLSNGVYILTIAGGYDNTTGLFYRVDYLEKMVNNNDWNIERDQSELMIERVVGENEYAVYVPVFDNPYTYIDHNFLPRRTLPTYS